MNFVYKSYNKTVVTIRFIEEAQIGYYHVRMKVFYLSVGIVFLKSTNSSRTRHNQLKKLLV